MKRGPLGVTTFATGGEASTIDPSLSTWAGRTLRVNVDEPSHHFKGCGTRVVLVHNGLCVPRVLDEFELQLHQQVSAQKTKKEA